MVAGTTVGGTSAFGGSCGGAVFAPERVFQWTPTVSHDASISLCGSPFATNFDSVLYVREGTCVGPELACNDDGGSFMCGRASRIALPAVAGTTYFIVVDGFASETGNFSFSVM
ncbi:hypothetical protein L6Q96_04190 [Candidatus Binatia bacterium]|nr:hypothetical protein [Candidatus Binatia bacterium]